MTTTRLRQFLVLWIGLTIGLVGCGYRLGYQMPANVYRMAVPMFRNETFPLRREFEFDLTRAVRRELELRTDAQLVSSDHADAVLNGTIVDIRERVLTEGPLDSIQESSIAVTVAIQLVRRSDDTVLVNRIITDHAAFSAVDGENIDTARQEALGEIAERIVAALEQW